MQAQKLRYIRFLIFTFLCVPMIALAQEVPSSIRIGLESVAKDVYEVVIKSEDDLTIGYFRGDRWIEEGTLDTNEVRVKPINETYYTYQEDYATYEEAYEEAMYYEDALVAYVQPEEYRIYTPYAANGTDEVRANGNRVSIQDKNGNVLLVSENDKMPLGFTGYYDQYDFSVTGVGNERLYRGVIEVVKGQYKGLTAVSVVDFEDYLYGVVNNEMGGSNPIEALKAQAVAARSMAVFQYNRYNARGYNLVDTTYSQVYRGVTSENGNTTKAVDATRGEIALYNGRVAETVYGSSSGGHTENPKYIWGNDVPYLRGIPDLYEENNHDWTRTITLADIDKCLKDDGINIGRARGMEILSFTSSGRVKELRIIGSEGDHILTKEMPRTFFHAASGGSLKSTLYQFTPYTGNEQWEDDEDSNSGTSLEEVYVQSSGKKEQVALDGLYAEGEKTLASLDGDDTIYIMTGDGMTSNKATGKNRTVDAERAASDRNLVYGDVTLYGKGFGHGVGMSQNGAISMAKKGYTYDEILKYYYSGIEIR
ncbi:MAG: SpoIID/LytB domain-containing protein [Cellulosilyticaceae bacterium]